VEKLACGSWAVSEAGGLWPWIASVGAPAARGAAGRPLAALCLFFFLAGLADPAGVSRGAAAAEAAGVAAWPRVDDAAEMSAAVSEWADRSATWRVSGVKG
jgi:hypothetical protein